MTEPEPLSERLKRLFPGLRFDRDLIGDAIRWESGEYVSGWKDKLTLDGEFTAEQLRALAEWMDNRIAPQEAE